MRACDKHHLSLLFNYYFCLCMGDSDLEEDERIAAEDCLQIDVINKEEDGCSTSQPKSIMPARREEEDVAISAIQECFVAATAELSEIEDALTRHQACE